MTSSTLDYENLTKRIDYDGRSWLWPKYDEKLLLVNDWVNDLNSAILLMQKDGREFRNAIQAGGACGVWPVAMAEHFQIVWTYEPDHLNFWCLSQNCSHLPQQISAKCAALSDHIGMSTCHLHDSEAGNAGAIYTMPSTKGDMAVPTVKLDDEPVFHIDLICLDIEGREVEALRGAKNIIERDRPWIMIEEKALPQMGPGKDVNHQPGEATEWLEKIHGYTVAKHIHRDVILRPPE